VAALERANDVHLSGKGGFGSGWSLGHASLGSRDQQLDALPREACRQ
jgi:hypothetical protein